MQAAMNLEDALELMMRAQREVHAAEEAYNHNPRAHWTSGDIPSVNYVATEDGRTFGVLGFEGQYSDYHEFMVWSAEEWDAAKRGWFNAYLNPEGEWTRRTVVKVEPISNPHGSLRYRRYLSCGHREASGLHRNEDIPAVGSVTWCHSCRDEMPCPSLDDLGISS